MRIVNIIGGLGNQMFQYAFALALKERFPNEEVLIDISHFKHFFIKKFRSANLHNGFEIDNVFPLADLPIAQRRQLVKVTYYIPNYVISRLARKVLPNKPTELIQKPKDYFTFNPEVFDCRGDVYYEGIWESVQYLNPIREQIQRAFTHPEPDDINADFIRRMETEDSVGIHIRRGDYLQHDAFRGICELDYYQKAIKMILSNETAHTFYVFSNDMEWCEANIRPLINDNPLVMLTHNKGKQSCWDMFLMTHCKDLIIANSSFSWWGAFLNSRRGRVIAPQKWANRDAEYDIWLKDWERI